MSTSDGAPGHVRLRLTLVVMAPLLFLLIPRRWLEAHPVPCLSRLILRRRCPGCGMTRAVSCALHGHWRAAWRHNPRVVIVLPLLAWEWSGLAAQAASSSERGVYC